MDDLGATVAVGTFFQVSQCTKQVQTLEAARRPAANNRGHVVRRCAMPRRGPDSRDLAGGLSENGSRSMPRTLVLYRNRYVPLGDSYETVFYFVILGIAVGR